MFDHLPAPPGEQEPFHGFTLPTTTPIPDQLIDDWLPALTGAELKVLLYICRRTLGFHKISDNISLHQLLTGLIKKNGERLDYGTGLSKPTLLKTLRDLQEKGLITTVHRSSSERGDEATNYRLCFADGVQPLVCHRRATEVTPVGWRHTACLRGQESLPGGRAKNLTTGVVKKPTPQHTVVQETEKQETDTRSITQGTNNTSSAPPAFGGGVLSDEVFWSAANQPEEALHGEVENDTNASSVKQAPPPPSGAPPSPTLERQQTGASALIAIGMTAKVAQRLAEHYSLERIEEKLSYLDFLQQHHPHKVKNPCGWLRKAIEDDFAAPDGYCSAAEQDAHQAAMLALADQLLAADTLEPDDGSSAEPAPPEQPVVTDADRALWQEVQCQVQCMGRPAIAALLADARIVTCTADTALIAVPTADQVRQLSHPRLQLLISRALTLAAGRALTPAFVPLQTYGAPEGCKK